MMTRKEKRRLKKQKRKEKEIKKIQRQIFFRKVMKLWKLGKSVMS